MRAGPAWRVSWGLTQASIDRPPDCLTAATILRAGPVDEIRADEVASRRPPRNAMPWGLSILRSSGSPDPERSRIRLSVGLSKV